MVCEWPAVWSIGGRVSIQNHFKWGKSILAAMMTYIKHIRIDPGNTSPANKGITYAEMVLDFEISTGHFMPIAGSVQSKFGGESNLSVSQRAQAFAHVFRALTKYVSIDGKKFSDVVLGVEKSAALYSFGIGHISGLSKRFVLINEPAVFDAITAWRDTNAKYFVESRIENNKAKAGLPAHKRRKCNAEAHGGTRAWIPSSPMTILANLHAEAETLCGNLKVKGSETARAASLKHSDFERESQRIDINLSAKVRHGHLVSPAPRDETTSCELCVANIRAGSILAFSRQTCWRSIDAGYEAAFDSAWERAMKGVPMPRKRRRFSVKGGSRCQTSRAPQMFQDVQQ